MSPVEWYYARENKQSGPISAVELKRLADAGQLRPDDLVWREGMAEWSAARNVRGLFEEEGRAGEGAAAKPAAPAAAVAATGAESSAVQSVPDYLREPERRHLFDALLERFRPRFDARFVEATARVFWSAGFYGLLAAMLLTAVFAVAATVHLQNGSAAELVSGAAVIVALAALHYAAWKFRDVLDRLNRETAGRLASNAFPNCFAVLIKAAGAFALLASIAAAVVWSQYFLILGGAAVFLVGCYAAVVAINPAALNISIDPGLHPGEEAVGVFLFLLKTLARSTPAAFGAGVVLSALGMGYAGYLAAFGDEKALAAANSVAFVAEKGLIFSAALPLAAYLVFVFGCLLLDLCRAILGAAVPTRTDAAAKEEEKSDEPAA